MIDFDIGTVHEIVVVSASAPTNIFVFDVSVRKECQCIDITFWMKFSSNKKSCFPIEYPMSTEC